MASSPLPFIRHVFKRISKQLCSPFLAFASFIFFKLIALIVVRVMMVAIVVTATLFML
jgi:hypothetical protein